MVYTFFKKNWAKEQGIFMNLEKILKFCENLNFQIDLILHP